MNECGALMER